MGRRLCEVVLVFHALLGRERDLDRLLLKAPAGSQGAWRRRSGWTSCARGAATATRPGKKQRENLMDQSFHADLTTGESATVQRRSRPDEEFRTLQVPCLQRRLESPSDSFY